jgi:hypothetical protein
MSTKGVSGFIQSRQSNQKKPFAILSLVPISKFETSGTIFSLPIRANQSAQAG